MVILLAPFYQVPMGILHKRLAFKKLSLIEVKSNIVYGIIAIVLAWQGLKFGSILIAHYASVCFTIISIGIYKS